MRSFARNPRDIMPGPRSREVECFARVFSFFESGFASRKPSAASITSGLLHEFCVSSHSFIRQYLHRRDEEEQ